MDSLKSAEFVGYRVPSGDNVYLQDGYNATAGTKRSINNFEFGYPTRDQFHCLKDQCLIIDFVLTMYNLDLSFLNLDFDNSVEYG